MTQAYRDGAVVPGRRVILRSVVAIASLLFVVLSQTPAAVASPAQLQKREWWIGRLGLTSAWQITKGAGVTVAVVDEGVDATVGDLQGALVPGFTVGDSESPDTAHDSRGHGTAMALDIAGRGTGPGILGVAPQAKVMPIYLPDQNSGTPDVLDRLSALSRPPQIVNMSYGAPGNCPADLQTAVAKAVAKGMILVASAGNDGSTSNQNQYPSNCKGVIAVGAFDSDAKPWVDTQRQPYVSLGGPGVDIVTYDRARAVGTADGTSDAAAIVSGEFALLRSKFPTMPSRQLVARMFATASKSAYHGPRYGQAGDTLGFGPALVHQALIRSVPASAPNPVYDALAKISAPPPTTSDTSGTASSPSSVPTTTSTPTGQVGVNFPGADKPSSSSGGSGVVIGIVIALVVVLALIIGLVFARRRKAAHASAGWPGPSRMP